MGEENRTALGGGLGRRGRTPPEGQDWEEAEQSKVSSRTGTRMLPQSLAQLWEQQDLPNPLVRALHAGGDSPWEGHQDGSRQTSVS